MWSPRVPVAVFPAMGCGFSTWQSRYRVRVLKLALNTRAKCVQPFPVKTYEMKLQ